MAGFICGAPGCKESAGSTGALTRHHEGCEKWAEFQQIQINARRDRAALGINPHKTRPGGTKRKSPPPATALQQRKFRLGHSGPSSLPNNTDPESQSAGSSFTQNSLSDDFDMVDISPEDSYTPIATSGPALIPPPSPPPDPESGEAAEISACLRVTGISFPNHYPPTRATSRDVNRQGHLRNVLNTFGLWRSYLHRPTYDPDSLVSLDDLSNQFAQRQNPTQSTQPPATTSAAPPSTANYSTSRLMRWFNNGTTTKSQGELNSLVHDVLLDPKFDVEELAKFDAGRANKQVDADAKTAFPLLSDFKEASVEIEYLAYIIAASFQ
ncbi:hypothetical protein B0H17DRAFT_1148855 [Mycena rosella]|uniref:Uncharacterized protein n=1 Tax=Mycena rosella TaxID=1033263 RepID=A0AAD7C6Q3_MYCRO|nr:hypothetical protein B0H17DRAFT_1148855 [Mycena rosella]